MTDLSHDPKSASEFLPKIVTVWREGYDLAALRADAIAGLTVAIVALPLSMAIAIASGRRARARAVHHHRRRLHRLAAWRVALSDRRTGRGLHRADLGLRGGHRPAGVDPGHHPVGPFPDRLAGVLRLGSYVRYIPYPVTLGFTAGIAVIILASQMKDLFGLHLPGAEPAAILPKVAGALGRARQLYA